jgi:hypothetical protein
MKKEKVLIHKNEIEMKKLDIITKLEEFELAFGALNSAWLNCTDREIEIALEIALESGYPFKSDFNELHQDVSAWVKSVSGNLEILRNKKIERDCANKFLLFSNSKVKLSNIVIQSLAGFRIEEDFGYLYHTYNHIELTDDYGTNVLVLDTEEFIEGPKNLRLNELRLFKHISWEKNDENAELWAGRQIEMYGKND